MNIAIHNETVDLIMLYLICLFDIKEFIACLFWNEIETFFNWKKVYKVLKRQSKRQIVINDSIENLIEQLFIMKFIILCLFVAFSNCSVHQQEQLAHQVANK